MLIHRVAALFGRRRRDRELGEELEAHLAMAVADRIRAGEEPAEAGRQAALRLGSWPAIVEAYRDRRAVPVIETVARDLRYACRLAARGPGFAAVVVLTLGVRIGANTAVFSVLDPVMLRTLPLPDAERLVILQAGSRRGERQNLSYPMFEYLRDTGAAFAALLASQDGFSRLDVSGPAGDQGAEARVQLVLGEYFDVLGVRAAAGRTLGRDDNRVPGGHAVAVLSYRYWRRRFAADSSIVGATLRIRGQPFTIVGVADRRFSVPR